MSDLIFTFLFQIGILIPFLVLGALVSREFKIKYVFLALALISIDFILLVFTRKIPGLSVEGLQYNWFGKLASLLLSISIFTLWPSIRQECGLTWKQTSHSLKPALIMLGFLAVAGISIGMINSKVSFNFENFAFQLIMPSLDEELFFRGILFYLFSRAFLPKAKFKKYNWASMMIVTVWFGLVHSVGSKAGVLQFDVLSFTVTGVISGTLMGLRVVYGSLVFPVVGHSLYNVLIQTVKIIGK